MADISNLNFNATEHEDSGREPLPKGDYSAILIETEIKDTKAGTGRYIRCVYEVTEGDHGGRKIFDNINISNPNSEAERIGQARLAQLCKAVGILTPKDTEELHDRPVLVRLALEKRKDKDEMENQVKAILPANGKKTAAPAEEKAEAPAKKTPPWKK
jgi:hypothetical protein